MSLLPSEDLPVWKGKAIGWFQGVNLLNATLSRWVHGALLGQPLCPEGFVHPAAVKQGSNQGLLLQVQLLGNVSFRVLLLRGGALGPGLALRVG